MREEKKMKLNWKKTNTLANVMKFIDFAGKKKAQQHGREAEHFYGSS